MLRWQNLPPLGRGIIVAVGIGTAAVAAVAFLLSYGALYAWVHDTHLYADAGPFAHRLELAWPLMLDATFIIAELAAILGGLLRGPRGWPILVMVLTGVLTVWFNILHAGQHAGPRIAAALPPVLMMACMQIDLRIVSWVMNALGRSRSEVAAGAFLGVPQAAPQMQTRTWPGSESGQLGQWGSGADGGAAPNKKSHILATLERLGPEEAMMLGPEGIAAELPAGVDASPRYVRKVMDELAAGRNGHGRS